MAHSIMQWFKSMNVWRISLYCLFICTGNSCSKRTEIDKGVVSNSDFKCFNVPGYIECLSIERTSDWGFIYSGIDKSRPGNAQGFLMKVNAEGEQMWYKTYGGAKDDGFSHSIETSDGGFVAVGSTNSVRFNLKGELVQSNYFLKTDANGNLVWENHDFWYYSSDSSSINSQLNYCAEAGDHSIVVGGRIVVGSPIPAIAKIDQSSGKVIKRKYFSPSSLVNYFPYVSVKGYVDWASNVSFSDDNDILLSGEMSSSNGSTGLAYKVPMFAKLSLDSLEPSFYQKYNSTDVMNNITYVDYQGGGSFLNFYNEIARKPAPQKVINQSDGFLIGTFYSPFFKFTANYTFNMSLIKTDVVGNFLWKKSYEGLGNSLLWDIQKTDNGNLLLIGSSTKDNFSNNCREGFLTSKLAILTVDKDGTLISQLFVGSEGSRSEAKSLHQMADGGYLIAGLSYDPRRDVKQMFWVRLDKNGQIVKK